MIILVCQLPQCPNYALHGVGSRESPSNVTIFTSHYQGGSVYNVRAEYLDQKESSRNENKGWMNGEKVYYIYPKGINLYQSTVQRDRIYTQNSKDTFAVTILS